MTTINTKMNHLHTLEQITYTSCQHIIHESTKTPPIHCFAMATASEYLRCPAIMTNQMGLFTNADWLALAELSTIHL